MNNYSIKWRKITQVVAASNPVAAFILFVEPAKIPFKEVKQMGKGAWIAVGVGHSADKAQQLAFITKV